MPEDFEPGFDGLAEDVGRRADLRELVHDLARLPDDQREALVLFELGGSSHKDIAQVLACPPAKVKALVFQARSSLIAERDARSTPCEAIREQLAVARGGVLRRGPLRRHLRQCAPCDAYRLAVAGQRDGLALLLPVIPSAGLKAAVLAAAGLSGGGGTAAAGGGAASLLGGAAAGGGSAGTAGGVGVTALVAKVAVTVAVAGAGVSAAVAAVGSATAVSRPRCGSAHPTPAHAAQPGRPAASAPSPAPAHPPAEAGTENPPVTTPPRFVVRTRAILRHRARARRHRLRAVLRRLRIAALAPRRANRIDIRREARRQARRRARRERRPSAPRSPTRGLARRVVGGSRSARDLSARRRPAPVPQATATPMATPTAAAPHRPRPRRRPPPRLPNRRMRVDPAPGSLAASRPRLLPSDR